VTREPTLRRVRPVPRGRATRQSTAARPLALAQRVLDAIPYPTFGCTRDFQFEWANAAARTYFGLGEQALAELGRRAPGPRAARVGDRAPHRRRRPRLVTRRATSRLVNSPNEARVVRAGATILRG
jgi:PAS domain-containing protein